MSYLLDTNVISEVKRQRATPQVVDWLDRRPPEALFISVLTVGELRKGVEQLSPGRRKQELLLWLEAELPDWFGDRMLPIDFGVADRWGRLLASVGRPLPAVDSLLAATALRHDLCLVTRNAGDFQVPGLTVFNPWSER